MQVKTYLGKIEVTIGEYSNEVSYLIVANSEAAAYSVLRDAAICYYGDVDDDVPEDATAFESNGGEISVRPGRLEAIGLATFLDLKKALTVRCQDNVAAPGVAALESEVGFAAQQLCHALEARGIKVGHSQMLEALASGWGHKTWQVLKAKSNLSCRTQLARLVELSRNVIWSADDTGCTDDLTVASKEEIESLKNYLDVADRALSDAFPAGLNTSDTKLALTDSPVSLPANKREHLVALLVADKEQDLAQDSTVRRAFCTEGFVGFSKMSDAALLTCADDARLGTDDL